MPEKILLFYVIILDQGWANFFFTGRSQRVLEIDRRIRLGMDGRSVLVTHCVGEKDYIVYVESILHYKLIISKAFQQNMCSSSPTVFSSLSKDSYNTHRNE